MLEIGDPRYLLEPLMIPLAYLIEINRTKIKIDFKWGAWLAFFRARVSPAARTGRNLLSLVWSQWCREKLAKSEKGTFMAVPRPSSKLELGNHRGS